MRPILNLLLITVVTLAPAGVGAAPCDRLSGERRALADKITRATYPYDCCDESLDRCLAQKKVCKLARRLRDDICRRVARGEDEKKVRSALDRRARSMTPGVKRASIDLGGAELAGDPKAKVVVVAYACARCPFCSKVVPDLYRLATAGPLRGKLALYFKTFPISGHKGSVEGGLAFLGAARLKRFWPYALKLYAEYDRFSTEKLPVWAKEVGLDAAAFARETGAPKTRELLVASKKEGLRNGVEATPTLFINSRKYSGDLDHETLLDVLDEEVDRTESRQHCGP